MLRIVINAAWSRPVWFVALAVGVWATPVIAADQAFFGFMPLPDDNIQRPTATAAFSREFVSSGSKWDKEADEREVFFARLWHQQEPDRSWDVRFGRAGQIYSFRGPFGESIPPQTHPWMLREKVRNMSVWMDEVWQGVAVCSAKQNHDKLYRPGSKAAPQNLITAMKYFIHQSGVYLRDPTLKRPLYSPMLASHWDERTKTFSTITWGQQANPPSLHESAALFYTRYRDCGDGVLEVTYGLYNFGDDWLDYLNMPWGGVRTSSLPQQWFVDADGEATQQQCSFEQGIAKLNDSAGYFVWAQEGDDPERFALGVAFGRDRHLGNVDRGFKMMPSRVRWGFAGANHLRDYSVFTVNARPVVKRGDFFYWRNYFVVGQFNQVADRCRALVRAADYGMVKPANRSSLKRWYVVRQIDGRPQILHVPTGGTLDANFGLDAWPAADSLPLLLMRDKATGREFVSADLYVNAERTPFANPYPSDHEKHDRYENRTAFRTHTATGYIRLLGFVQTRPDDAGQMKGLANELGESGLWRPGRVGNVFVSAR